MMGQDLIKEPFSNEDQFHFSWSDTENRILKCSHSGLHGGGLLAELKLERQCFFRKAVFWN
ncbi:MAG: hypothetical protein ACI9V8_001798 [Urechidicola sp.]|jgi:hypothetical protein